MNREAAPRVLTRPVTVSLALVAAATCQGASADRVILAAMALSEKPNYSWTSSVEDDARSYVIEGRTEVGGHTWMRLPMVKSIAQRLGREAEYEVEALFRGPARCVIRTGRGWKTLRELPRRWDKKEDVELWAVTPPPHVVAMNRAGHAGLDPLDHAESPPPAVMARGQFAYEEDETGPYSNAQFALSHPHEDLAVIVSSYAHLRVDGEVASGTLSDVGARLLLVRDGQEELKPLAAAGVFRLHLQGGMVVRYQVRLEGILMVGRRRVAVHQLTSTFVRNVGTTAVALPHEARQKLSY